VAGAAAFFSSFAAGFFLPAALALALAAVAAPGVDGAGVEVAVEVAVVIRSSTGQNVC
jgi:hypothetical protein